MLDMILINYKSCSNNTLITITVLVTKGYRAVSAVDVFNFGEEGCTKAEVFVLLI
jgi:hypothetical protein